MSTTNTDVRMEDDTLTVTRVYDAPRDEVFDAWVAVNKVEKWWGCNQTVAVQSQVEPRVGGKYFHKMTHTSAGEFNVDGCFTEFQAPERLAYRISAPTMDGQPSAEDSVVTVTFDDVDGKTRVTLTHAGIVDPMARQHVPHGWSAAFEKLDTFLTTAAA